MILAKLKQFTIVQIPTRVWDDVLQKVFGFVLVRDQLGMVQTTEELFAVWKVVLVLLVRLLVDNGG